MYLSMWIIREQLKNYNVETHIQDGAMNIRAISPLYYGDNIRPHTLYVGPSEEYFHSIKNKVICVNNNDYLIISDLSVEDAFELINKIMENFLEWDLTVRDAIDDHCTIQDIIDQAASVLQTLCGSYDTTFTKHGVAIPDDIDLSLANNEVLEQMPGMGAIYTFLEKNRSYIGSVEPYLFFDSTLDRYILIQNLFLNGLLWGFCFITVPDAEVNEATRQLLHVLQSQLLRWLKLNHEPVSDLEQNPYFFSLLKDTSAYSKETLLNYFEQIGWEKEDIKYILRIVDLTGDYFIYQKLYRQIAGLSSGCISLRLDDSVVCIINERFCSLEYILEQLQIYSYQNKIVIGISHPYTNLLQTNIGYEQAKIASFIENSEDEFAHHCQDHMIVYANYFLKKEPLFTNVHPVLRFLQDYDHANHTDFYNTLRCYLYEERSIKQTSAKLKIHKNTLLFRIRKIQELLNINLDDIQTRINLLFAYLLQL